MEIHTLRNIVCFIKQIKYILIFIPEIYNEEVKNRIFTLLRNHYKKLSKIEYNKCDLEPSGEYYFCS
jgi:hypothetical protein